MLEHKVFLYSEDAIDHIKKILAELDTPHSLEFQVIHSVSETKCYEDGGDWNEASVVLNELITDLDAQSGYMVYIRRDNIWDYIDIEERKINYYQDETYIRSNEGLVVLYNRFAVCDEQFPIIVIKKSFWQESKNRILELLKKVDVSDYTAQISPAVYVELFPLRTKIERYGTTSMA